ncbi:hypothetical protein ACV357_34665, partial [Pseudomonas aeruginosa]
ILDLADFGRAVKQSNVGAHASSSYLSKPAMEEFADKCGLHAVICDALNNLDVSKVGSFIVVNLVAIDFEAYMV